MFLRLLVVGLLVCGSAWGRPEPEDAPAPPEGAPDDAGPDKDWWQTAVFYQIYPRSFKDTDGDGIGDLKGVTENLEHFVEAGITAIWLSPIFQSPMIDFGYDISDFRAVHHEYGTMEDFEELVSKSKELGLKVVLDFVPNHASDESNYFKLSANRTEGYEDFFIWDDGLLDPSDNRTILPPSNWISLFQGKAWEWHEGRQQFYLHQFSVHQPDLNYRNPIVVEEMLDVMSFWLNKGIAGFRIDAVPHLIEAQKQDFGGRYPDEPLSGLPGYQPDELGYVVPIYTKDQSGSYDLVYMWRSLLDSYKEKDGETRVMLTEAYTNVPLTMRFYGDDERPGSHVPFNFDFVIEVNGKSSARDIVYTALRWLTYMPNGMTANWVFGNHDNSRIATRFGSHLVDGFNMLDLLLPGVAVTYQGDEIGMENGYVSWEDTVDVSGCNAGQDHPELSRDPERTPFQWDSSMNAGFSTANKTWLPVGLDYENLNLENQRAANRSHFKVYQALTKARSQPTIQKGDWNIKPISDNVFGLTRTLKRYLSYGLVVNMGSEDTTADMTIFKELGPSLTVYIASVNSTRNPEDKLQTDSVSLAPGESIVFTSPPK